MPGPMDSNGLTIPSSEDRLMPQIPSKGRASEIFEMCARTVQSGLDSKPPEQRVPLLEQTGKMVSSMYGADPIVGVVQESIQDAIVGLKSGGTTRQAAVTVCSPPAPKLS